MALLDSSGLPTPETPAPPTVEELQARLRTQVLNEAQRLNGLLRKSLEAGQTRLWAPDGTDGLTRQQRFDAFGTKAAELFAVALKTTELLVATDPTFTPHSAPVPYTINEDGTVTLTEE